MNPLELIRDRSREEWLGFAREKWTEIRIWIQENGELALVLGLLAGLFVGQAFKFFVSLLVLIAVVLFGAYIYALPEAQQNARKRDSGLNEHSSE